MLETPKDDPSDDPFKKFRKFAVFKAKKSNLASQSSVQVNESLTSLNSKLNLKI